MGLSGSTHFQPATASILQSWQTLALLQPDLQRPSLRTRLCPGQSRRQPDLIDDAAFLYVIYADRLNRVG